MATEPSPIEQRSIRGGRLGNAVAVVCWLGLLVLVVLVVLGRLDKAPGSVLTGLLFFLPHGWTAHLVGVFGIWCVLPDRRSFPTILVLSFAGALGLWGPGVATWTAPEAAAPVRVMSWNVQRLWGGPGEALAPACVAEVVRREDPDVLALMEVSESNLEQLASLGLVCVHTTYTSQPGAKRGGLAVCGRNGWSAAGAGQRFVSDEDWLYLPAEVRHGEQVLNVLAVHLMPHHFGATSDATERVAARQANQSAALLDRVRRLRDPTVVAGDFNSTRDFYLHHALRGHLQDAWEAGGLGFGATKYVWDWLPLRIDFVYASEALQVAETHVDPSTCSDHRPVTTRLVFAD